MIYNFTQKRITGKEEQFHQKLTNRKIELDNPLKLLNF
ncbi:MAG: hypothetical protein MRERC_1c141 [Mycoplasmataceae bacterium RC_NB112A]|nr:MAG: hypothetical protein MRERC_1c141 [Mycoplasmataceae bacterium RC_NB112A]